MLILCGIFARNFLEMWLLQAPPMSPYAVVAPALVPAPDAQAADTLMIPARAPPKHCATRRPCRRADALHDRAPVLVGVSPRGSMWTIRFQVLLVSSLAPSAIRLATTAARVNGPLEASRNRLFPLPPTHVPPRLWRRLTSSQVFPFASSLWSYFLLV